MSPRHSGVRCFIALELPRGTRAELARWARRAVRGEARLLDPEAMHLTVLFLGERDASELGELGEAVEACAAAVGELETGAPLWLPPRRPRAVAVAVADPGGTLAALHADVVRATAVDPERRRYRPHVTVARLGRGAGAGGEAMPTPALRFEPEALTLMRSRLDPGGARYEPLVRVTLEGP